MYTLLLLDEEQSGVVQEALRFKFQTLIGMNRVQVVARNQCLYREEDDAAKAIEEHLAENDRKMEILNDLSAQMEVG